MPRGRYMRTNNRKPKDSGNEKWEYKDVCEAVDVRNKLGAEGWQCYAVTQSQYGGFWHHFKRQLR